MAFAIIAIVLGSALALGYWRRGEPRGEQQRLGRNFGLILLTVGVGYLVLIIARHAGR